MNASTPVSRRLHLPLVNRRALPLLVVSFLLVPAASLAQERPLPTESARPQDEAGSAVRTPDSRAARAVKFLLGGAAGLGLHESGHLLFDGIFGVRPEIRKVDFAGIPFFAIAHPAGQPPRREFTIASAGFWMQNLSSEIILTRQPHLRDRRAPLRKGMLAFNVLASTAYGAAAFAKAGPVERDTRAMADSLRVNEPWVGALVLVPAGLDTWRYFHPDSRWAKWVSRGAKVGMVLLLLRP